MYMQIDLMLMGKKPVEAMRCLEQLELFPVIFTAKLKINPPLVGDYGRYNTVRPAAYFFRGSMVTNN